MAMQKMLSMLVLVLPLDAFASGRRKCVWQMEIRLAIRLIQRDLPMQEGGSCLKEEKRKYNQLVYLVKLHEFNLKETFILQLFNLSDVNDVI